MRIVFKLKIIMILIFNFRTGASREIAFANFPRAASYKARGKEDWYG